MTASQQIRRLGRLIETAGFGATISFSVRSAAPLLWIPQFAMAIESWRQRIADRRIGKWTAAIGEFEALCSLAASRYERPMPCFRSCSDGVSTIRCSKRTALSHPLIPPESAIANDVTIGGEARLWIVSGSNMSGKSTLMRAIGLERGARVGGAPVTCARLRISQLHIGASMRANDSLVGSTLAILRGDRAAAGYRESGARQDSRRCSCWMSC